MTACCTKHAVTTSVRVFGLTQTNLDNTLHANILIFSVSGIAAPDLDAHGQHVPGSDRMFAVS